MFLLDDVFFNYLENIFFTHPDKKWTAEELLNSVALSYKSESYVQVGIAYLMQKGSVEQINEDAKDLYTASKSAIEKRKKEQKY